MKRVLLHVADPEQSQQVCKVLQAVGVEIVPTTVPVDENFVKTSAADAVLIDADIFSKSFSVLSSALGDKPVIAWMHKKDPHLALELLEEGAFDCLFPPPEVKEFEGMFTHIFGTKVEATYFSEEKSAEKSEEKTAFSLPAFLSNISIFQKINPVIIASVAGAIILGLVAFFMFPKSQKLMTITAQFQNPSGITLAGSKVYVSDWFAQNIYEYNSKDPNPVRTINFPMINPLSVTYVDSMLYISCAGGNIAIYDISAQEPLLVNEFKTPGRTPSGLCVQGKYIWTTDSDTAKIYKFNKSTPEAPLEEHSFPGASPAGLFWDGSSFWSCDIKTNKIYKMKFTSEDEFKIVATYTVMPQGTDSMCGITGDTSNIWVVYSGKRSKIVKYPKDKLK
jgi:hypothetical protein